jgi:hypothetical protein
MQVGKEKIVVGLVPGASPNPASQEWAQAVRDLGNDASLLNEIAWRMVAPGTEFSHPNLDFALSAAQRANQLMNGLNPEILDTLARVHFSRGEVGKAIEFQTKAVAIVPEDKKESFSATLSEYQEKKGNAPADSFVPAAPFGN